ncbi:hypothetical protein [Staphylococcus cohnii]|uniref:hypothetical protein n=1 Tax=Staphylococcus cohnii TaxID=29382 RepID=UPI003CEBF961
MINYEMALSEIEMYEKAHESLSENLTHANKKAQQFKEERDTLIDDLSWYKSKVSRLERENRFLLSRKDDLFDIWRNENKRSVALSEKLEQLERENEEMKEEMKRLHEESNITVFCALMEENSELKKENERLERELAAALNGELATYDGLQKYVLELQKDLNTYFDEWQSVKKLYTTLTSHIRTKAECNPGVSRYIDLVNFIDRLERD